MWAVADNEFVRDLSRLDSVVNTPFEDTPPVRSDASLASCVKQ